MELTSELLAKLPMEFRIEIEENVMRKDLTQSELAEQQERILKMLREHGSQQGRRTDLEETSGTIEPTSSRATEVVAKMFGESRHTVEKRLALVRAAESEPEKYGPLRDDMDRTGRVENPYRRLKISKQAEAIRCEPPPLPGRGPYNVIAADPPWHYELRENDPSHARIVPYPTMTIEQICAVEVASIAAKDCVLWLWTTNTHIEHAFKVLTAWGFEYKTMLTWAKSKFGTGYWLRGQSEHCLMAVRGKPTIVLTDQSTLLYGPVRGHSQKPDAFYELVESLCPAPLYCGLFSREQREGWDMHGDEVLRPAAQRSA
jgi:N6-adenosine-specific RNA methylase IME4